MGGVNIADQRRSYHSTQLTVCRNWLAIFFWLLDTTIINSYILVKELIPNPPSSELHWKHHAYFRTRPAWNLVHEGFQEINPTYAPSLQQQLRPKPTGNNCHCPGARPLGNNSLSRGNGYVGKNYELSARRKTPGVQHVLGESTRYPGTNKTKMYICVFCRYLYQQVKKDGDSECARLFRGGSNDCVDGPLGKVRSTTYHCKYCEVLLCKKFCFIMYYNI